MKTIQSILNHLIELLFDKETGDLNKNGIILAGIFFIFAMIVIGSIETGNPLPWS